MEERDIPPIEEGSEPGSITNGDASENWEKQHIPHPWTYLRELFDVGSYENDSQFSLNFFHFVKLSKDVFHGKINDFDFFFLT